MYIYTNTCVFVFVVLSCHSFALAKQHGVPTRLPSIDSIATSLGALAVTEGNYQVYTHHYIVIYTRDYTHIHNLGLSYDYDLC